MLVDSTFKRDPTVTRAVSPFFSFPKPPGPVSLMRPFSTFLVCFLLLLLIFYFYCFLSHPYILFFSFFYTEGWAVLPQYKQIYYPKALCLDETAIFNRSFCKQKEYPSSRTLLTRTFLWLSLRTNIRINWNCCELKDSPDCSWIAQHCFSALCIPSQPGRRKNK